MLNPSERFNCYFSPEKEVVFGANQDNDSAFRELSICEPQWPDLRGIHFLTKKTFEVNRRIRIWDSAERRFAVYEVFMPLMPVGAG